MVEIRVIHTDGREASLEAPAGSVLMTTLHEAGFVDAICGGGASCASCAVRVDADWQARLPPAEEGEAMLLSAFDELGPDCRLSCQLTVDDPLKGLTVRLLEAR